MPQKSSIVLNLLEGNASRRGLGLLIPLVIAISCSPPPQSVSPQLQLHPSSSAVPVERPVEIQPVKDEEGAILGVGPFQEVGSDRRESYNYNFVFQGIPSGVGLFSFYEFERGYWAGNYNCTIRTEFPNVCQTFSFTPWADKPVWPQRWLPERFDNLLGKEGKMFPSKASWLRFSPGQEGVYATSVKVADSGRTNLFIDFLRPNGKIETFLEDTSERFSDAEIVEVSGGYLGIFRLVPVAVNGRVYTSAAPLVAAPVYMLNGKRIVGNIKKLPIADVWWDGRTSDARDALTMQPHANYGPFRAVALLDKGGKQTGEVALVWVEVVPPPSYEEQKAQEEKKVRKKPKKAKNQCGAPARADFEERLAKRAGNQGDGCGGRISRQLSLREVKKKLHVTRLRADGSQVEDRSLDFNQEYNPEKFPMVAVARRGGGLIVKDLVLDETFRIERRIFGRTPFDSPDSNSSIQNEQISATIDPNPLDGKAPQQLVKAAFDPRSGDAVLLYREAVPSFHSGTSAMRADAFYARRISALGKPEEADVQIPELQDSFLSPILGRGKDAWLIFASTSSMFRVVGGIHHGASHPIRLPETNGTTLPEIKVVLPSLDGRLDLFFLFDYGASSLWQESVDSSTLLSTEPTSLEDIRMDRLVLDSQGLFHREDGRPTFWHLGEDGNPVLGGSGLKEENDGEKTTSQFRYSQHQVWGDVVVLAVNKKEVRATWLKANQTIQLEEKVVKTTMGYENLEGPIFSQNRWILPSVPGQPIEVSPELSKALSLCEVAMPTGPRRLLLACTEPTDDQLPAVRVGTRVVRY